MVTKVRPDHTVLKHTNLATLLRRITVKVVTRGILPRLMRLMLRLMELLYTLHQCTQHQSKQLQFTPPQRTQPQPTQPRLKRLLSTRRQRTRLQLKPLQFTQLQHMLPQPIQHLQRLLQCTPP